MKLYQSRFIKLGKVLAQLKLDDMVRNSSLKQYIPDRVTDRAEEYTLYERIRMAMEEMGSTYVKFGQLLSQRSDLFPEGFIKEMEKLQESVKAEEIDVRERIKEETGKPASKYFKNMQKKPIGTASIGQVYKAVLKTGEEVVLKVRRSGVRESVEADLQVMKKLLDIAANNPELAEYDPRQVYQAFEESMKDELDYLNEARTILRFENNYSANEKIKVPHVYMELCSESIICMELISGIKINNISEVESLYPDKDEVTTVICDYYFDQILEKGLFHADPHPGNIYIVDDNRICLLDYGMVGEVLPDDRDRISLLFYYLISQNVDKTIKILEEISTSFLVEDRKALEYDIYRLINDFNAPLEMVSVTEIIEKLLFILKKNKIGLPTYIFLILRTLVYLDGLVRMLSPKLNVLKFAEPYAQKAIEKRMDPRSRIKDMAEDVMELQEASRKLPVNINSLMKKIENDQFIVKMEVSNMKDSLSSLERASNKIVIAFLIGSLLIGSSLVVLANVPPYVKNIPVIGFVGYLIAALLSLRLIFRNR